MAKKEKTLKKFDNTLAQLIEGGNGLPPTDKSVGIRPTIL